ncbi:sensor histidine kinase [Cryomorphaceae bacterium]|nr:sensor histidine kinase [Cryomorphaceae bacterium]
MRLRLLAFALLIFTAGFAQDDAFEQRFVQTHFTPEIETLNEVISSPEDYYFKSLANFLIGDFRLSEYWLDSLALHGPMKGARQGRYYLLRGRVHRLRGDNLNAVHMFDSALVTYEALKDKEGVFRVYVDMLEHCRSSGVYEEAFVYLDRLNAMSSDPSISPSLRARFLHRKSALFIEAAYDSIDAATGHLVECIQLCRENNVPWHEATALVDLGYINHNWDGENPMPYYQRAKKIRTDLGHWRDLAQVRFQIARLYSGTGRFDLALAEIEAMEMDAIRYQWPIPQADVFKLKAQVYYDQGQYKESTETYWAYHELYCDLLEQQIDEQIAETMAKVGAESARNDLLRAENAMLVAEERLEMESNRKRLLILLSMSLIIILSSLFLFYRRSRLANIMLRDQQAVIESTNRKLEMTLEQKNHLYRELHHRVKNNLTTLSGLLYLQSRNLESDEAKKALGEARGRIQSMSLIHQGLYERDEEVQVKLSGYLEELLPNLLSSFAQKAEGVSWSIDCAEIELDIEKAMSLAMVVNELVTNSFKYAFNDTDTGELRIIGKLIGKDGWILSVQDNGPGMPEGYDWKNSRSLGLRLVNILVEEMGASFSYGYFSGFSDFSIVFQEVDDEA